MLKRSRLFALLALSPSASWPAAATTTRRAAARFGREVRGPHRAAQEGTSASVESGEIKVEASFERKGSSRLRGRSRPRSRARSSRAARRSCRWWTGTSASRGAARTSPAGSIATEDNAFVKFRGQDLRGRRAALRQFIRQQEQQIQRTGPSSSRTWASTRRAGSRTPSCRTGRASAGRPRARSPAKSTSRRWSTTCSRRPRAPRCANSSKAAASRCPKVSERRQAEGRRRHREGRPDRERGRHDIARKVALAATFKVPEGVNADGVTGGSCRVQLRAAESGRRRGHHGPVRRQAAVAAAAAARVGRGMPGGGLQTQ